MNLSYEESIAYLEEDLYRTPIHPKKDFLSARAAFLLRQVGDPQDSFRSIHVTGSNGKGSTTAMAASILLANGFRAGSFHSPHLQAYTERVRVDGVPISPEDWASHVSDLRPVIERMRSDGYPGYDWGRPSLFEIFFAIAALHFRAHNVSWAAVEAGMGGARDATNTLHSDVAVVTNVSLEHTAILGDTVQEIAREKAAIIKPAGSAVTAADDPAALSVITTRARAVGAPLLTVGRDIVVDTETVDEGVQAVRIDVGEEVHRASLHLVGAFQAVNAATAVGAAVQLRRRGVPISNEAICRGLESTRVAGRFELIPGHPSTLFDGAHNPAAARALAQTICQELTGRRIILVFAVMTDKDAASMVEALAPVASAAIVTRAPGTSRARDPREIAPLFVAAGVPTSVEDDPDAALQMARSLTNEGDVVAVCGSLYLVGWLRRGP